MINICLNCGSYAVKKEIIDDCAVCPSCGYKRHFLKLPLFIISGASCVGKTSACNLLQQETQDVVVMESDILWNNIYNTPNDDYKQYRELWLRVCKNISQSGKPVVLCGSATPEQFDCCDERRYFTDIHFLAIICDDETLKKRLKMRNVSDDNWINGSMNFNNWLKENADKASPNFTIFDNTNKTKYETMNAIKEWIDKNTNK